MVDRRASADPRAPADPLELHEIPPGASSPAYHPLAVVVAASPCGGECRLVASQKAVLVAVEHPRLHAGQAEALELCYLLDWVAIAEADGAFLTELQLWETGPMEVACVNPVSCTQRTIMDKKK